MKLTRQHRKLLAAIYEVSPSVGSCLVWGDFGRYALELDVTADEINQLFYDLDNGKYIDHLPGTFCLNAEGRAIAIASRRKHGRNIRALYALGLVAAWAVGYATDHLQELADWVVSRF